jgi:choline-sulfatase
VFTSDHGDFLGDYGMLRKGDTACRVLNHTPLLVRVPEGCGGPAPGRVTAAVSNVDLTPSLCNWCGVDTADALHGQDLAATARGETRRLPVMAQVRGRTADSPNLALYDERYRVTLWPNDGRIEAFDHAEDPMELNDLGGDGASADVRDRVDRLRDGVIRTLTPVHGRVSPW